MGGCIEYLYEGNKTGGRDTAIGRLKDDGKGKRYYCSDLGFPPIKMGAVHPPGRSELGARGYYHNSDWDIFHGYLILLKLIA
jgi:hypothetical protein